MVKKNTIFNIIYFNDEFSFCFIHEKRRILTSKYTFKYFSFIIHTIQETHYKILNNV